LASKSFALEPGGGERLLVSWGGGFKDLELSFDGQPLASFADPKQLKEPQAVSLPDGSTLDVQVASPFLFPELRLSRDGEPLPGSSGDPQVRHAAAWQVVAFVAVLNVVVGLLVEATGADFLRSIGAGWPSVISGLVYGVLAWFVRARSLVALAIAVALFVLDGVLVMMTAAQATGTPPVGGLVARAFLLIPMLRGFEALRALARPARRRAGGRAAPSAAAGARAARSVSAQAPAGAGRPAAAPAARVLTGDAERQRLQLTTRLNPAAAPNVAGRSRFSASIKGQAAVDAAAAALRFLVSKVQIGDAGLRVVTREGRTHELPWSGIGRIVARQLPPDPPWEAGLLLDLVAHLDGRWQPLRVFTTTLVNFPALGGPPAGSRLENLRRLARHVREKHAAVALDDATLAFVDGAGPPARLTSIGELAEYDAVYGAG